MATIVVDGKTGDDISLKPCTSKLFTEEKILRAWAKVGFVPFTRHCMTDKKVRRELGQQNVNTDLEVLHDNADLVASAEDHGLNRGVFIAAIPVAYRLQRVVDEDEQVRLLLFKKGAFSASAMWNHCGTSVGNAHVILRAQRQQLAIDEPKATAVTQNRMGRHAKLLANAQMALDKYKTVGSDAYLPIQNKYCTGRLLYSLLVLPDYR